MKRLVALIPSLAMGGAERSLIKLAGVLAEGGHEVTILCLGTASPDLLTEIDPAVHVEVLGGRRSASVKLLWSVWRYLRRLRPDAVMGWSLYANFLAVVSARLAGIPHVLVSERNYLPQMLSVGSSTPLRRWLICLLVRRLYGAATVVTANSQLSLRFLQKYAPGARDYAVIPNLADVETFDTRSREPLPANLPQDAPSPRLLALGRLHHQKGFDLLIKALGQLRERVDWALYVAGDGHEAQALAALVESEHLQDRVHFIGPVSNPFPLYVWADIVIAPSRFEGFPNVPLEAMCSGAAVLMADCDSGPRELSAQGRHARLVPVEDVPALAEALLAMGQDLEGCRALGRSAHQHVAGLYSRSAVKPRYMAVIETLCGP